MRKRSHRLPVLLIVFVAFIIICIAGIFIWLKSNTTTTPTKFEKQQNKQKIITTTTTQTTEETIKTTNNITTTDSSTSPTTEFKENKELKTITTTSFIENSSPIAEIIQKPPLQHIPICPEPNEIETNECKEEEENKGDQTLPNEDFFQNDILRPFEYFLNISLPNNNEISSQSLHLQLSLLVEVKQTSNILFLLYGQEMGVIGENDLRIWDCQQLRFICINSIIRQLDKQRIIIFLKENLNSGIFLRLHFTHLRIPLSSSKLLVQIPSPWERERAWILGSKLPVIDGPSLFPSIQNWTNTRSVFHLCLFHPYDIIARSNTIKENTGPAFQGLSKQLRTCFKETPQLPGSQFSFILFRNLQLVSLPETTKNEKILIELFIGAHLKPIDYIWAIEESQKAMKRMFELTGIDYPLNKLTIVSSPLRTGNDAMGGLGLIQIRDSWMEYPKFVHTHSLLVGQIVQQWTTNLLSICDNCIQKGLSMFIELILSSELSEDGIDEYSRRVAEIRRKLLGEFGGTTLRVMNSNINQQCIERVAFSLFTLDNTFGRESIINFLSLIFSKYSFVSECTTNNELSKLFFEASGKQKQAKNIFDFLLTTTTNSSSSTFPLIRIKVQPSSSLLTIEQNLIKNNIWIPIELIDDTGKFIKLILNSSEINTSLPMIVSAFLVASPSSFVRFIYNVENYIYLTECLELTKCPSIKQISIKDTFDDLCWALLQQKLNPLEEEIPKWKQLFLKLNNKGAVTGDCACCMQTEIEALKSHCRWTWLDKCKKIKMLN